MPDSANRLVTCTKATLTALVVLRFAVGWHFFSEGAKKLKDPDFRSASFLNMAVGPLSQYFYLLVPDPFGLQGLDEDACRATTARVHEMVLERIGDDPRKQEIAKQANEAQRQSLDYFFAEHRDQIAQHALDVQRYQQALRDPNIAKVDSGRAWLAQKRDELRDAAQPWIADLQSLDAAYRHELCQQLGLPELAADGVSGEGAGGKSWVDLTVSWTIFLTGVCLLLGFLTVPACLTGAAFVLTVMSTQPFWITGANLTYFPYQLVEVAALLLLAASGSGRFAGLDFFVTAAWRQRRHQSALHQRHP